MNDKERIQQAADDIEKFKACLYCGEVMKKLHPQKLQGIYRTCPKCGAVVGIARNRKGELYIHQTTGDYAHARR